MHYNVGYKTLWDFRLECHAAMFDGGTNRKQAPKTLPPPPVPYHLSLVRRARKKSCFKNDSIQPTVSSEWNMEVQLNSSLATLCFEASPRV